MQIKHFFILALLVVITGCASMFGDNSRQVAISSNPSGAAIFIDGKGYGRTPAVITLPQYMYGGKTITLKQSGYLDQDMQINSTFQIVGLWNILNLPVGFIIDGATGYMVKIAPSDTNMIATLQPVK